MKKMVAILGLMAVATFSHGQAIVSIANSAPGYLAATNTGLSIFAGGNNASGTAGYTSGPGGSYYYALLVQAYTGALTTNDPTANSWQFAVTGTNSAMANGVINAAGAAAGQPIPGWGAPTGASYDTGAEDYFLLVGWSGNLSAGATTPAQQWSLVLAQLQSGSYVGLGFVGVSALGYGYGGGGPAALPATSIWGVTAGMPGGLTSGLFGGMQVAMELDATPEPSTFALFGLGAAGLLIFRRRKK